MAYQGSRRPSSGGRGFSGGKPGGRSGGFGRGGSRGGGGGKRGPKKENIHPSKFIKAAKPVVEVKYDAKHTFRDFKTEEIIQKNIAKRGFHTPSPIQDQAIPLGLKGKDVIGIANTGTGKTVAFAVPMLDKIIKDSQAAALVMAPTRELALQILEECKALTVGMHIESVLLIGGAPMRPQLRDLKKRPRVVIGTPGRIKDHIEKKSLDLRRFNIIVLDEVDRMLDMGFVNDMRAILHRLDEKRQSFFFSATMDDKVREIIKEFSHNPEMVSVKTGDTSDNVEQNIVEYKSEEEKIEKLHDVLNENKDSKVLIFDETKRRVDKLTAELLKRGFKADAIHGNKSQGQRQRALNKFKDNFTRILVATDVAARGIDVSGITHVINYATPQSYSDYVHRIGRAGRAGQQGNALTFIEAGSARKSERSSAPRRPYSRPARPGGPGRSSRPSQSSRPSSGGRTSERSSAPSGGSRAPRQRNAYKDFPAKR